MTLQPSAILDWVKFKLLISRRRDASLTPLGPAVAEWGRAATWLGGELLVQAKWALMGVPLFPIATRWELLTLAMAHAPQQGLWLEFGVWNGESINFIADRGGRPVFGFDSFEGLPKDWSPRCPAGMFSTGGVLPRVDPRVNLIRGWFDQTLPPFVAAHPMDVVAFLHIDCDLYSSTRTVLTSLGRRITEGSIVVFDEFCEPVPDDEARAWREFCRQEEVKFRWLGSSITGSVALQVISPKRPSNSDHDARGARCGGKGR